MASAMELQVGRAKMGLRAIPAVSLTPSRPWRWPVVLRAALLTGVAMILNATIVGAVLGVPLFLFALSLLTAESLLREPKVAEGGSAAPRMR